MTIYVSFCRYADINSDTLCKCGGNLGYDYNYNSTAWSASND